MATESAEDTAVGRHWVEETIKRLGGEYKVTASEFKWRDDFPAPYMTTLTFTAGNTTKPSSMEFLIRQLEDCRNLSNRPVRATMEQQIRDALQDISKRMG